MTALVQITDQAGVRTLTMHRPEVHNAFHDALIAELAAAIEAAGQDRAVRAVVLTGSGASFSAGADLNWMRGMAKASKLANRDDSLRLARLMRSLQFCPKPTVARVNGSAYGGGLGLVACCDIAIGTDGAKFGFTEVKMGIVPAVISPYVIAAIGLRQARRLFLTGELFDADEAQRIGLLHKVVAPDGLDEAVAFTLKMLSKAGPEALREAKRLAFRVGGLDEHAAEHTDQRNAELIAQLRVSPEGQEGLTAFLDKRPPAWSAG